MNEEQKQNMAAFVRVLRTTDLPQTEAYLNIVEGCGCPWMRQGMCCLGVACEQVPDLSKRTEQGMCSSCARPFTYMVYGKSSVAGLPEEAKEFFGLTEEFPTVIHAGRSKRAHQLNDNLRLPFKVIGDAFDRAYLR